VAGNMQGVLKKGNDGFYRDSQHSEYGGVVTLPALSFANASYLHRTPWPLTGPNDRSGLKNAYQYISQQLRQCVSTGCNDIRASYTDLLLSASTWLSNLLNAQPPADCTGVNNPCGFDSEDFVAVKTQLLQELNDLIVLRRLQNAMVTEATDSMPEFRTILDTVSDNVLANIPVTTQVHIGANTTRDALSLAGDVGGYAGLIPDVGSGISATISTGIGLYNLLSDDGTTVNDPNGVSLLQQEQDFAAISELDKLRQNQYTQSISSIGVAFSRIVSDWGRMQVAAEPIIDGDLQFDLQDLSSYLQAYKLSTTRSLYSTLMPLNYYAVHYRYADPGLNRNYGVRPGWRGFENVLPLGDECFAWQGLPSLRKDIPQSYGFWEGALIDGPGASISYSANGSGNSYPFDAWWDLWFLGQKQAYDVILSSSNLYERPGCPPNNPSTYLPPASFFQQAELFKPIGQDSNALGFYKPWFFGRGTLIRQRAVSPATEFWRLFGVQGNPEIGGSLYWQPDPDNY